MKTFGARQSGRTTRMLQRASNLKSQGTPVKVVIFPRQEWYVKDLIMRHGLALERKDISTPREAIRHGMRGFNPHNIFMDHFVYEQAVSGVSRDARDFLEELLHLRRTWSVKIALIIEDEWCTCDKY